MSGAVKLSGLRKLMHNVVVNGKKGIQAYIVTSDDAHQSEYVPERDKRRQFISGFSGSAGTVVVTDDKALLWTDGRYFLEASEELDPPDKWTLMKEGVMGTPTIEDWLVSNLPTNSIVGVDPNLISNTMWKRIEGTVKSAGLALSPVEPNLIDEIWGNDQPPQVANQVVAHKIEYSGRPAGDKVKACFETMEKKKVSILVITALDQVAYLLNLRGSDISFNPVFAAYMILVSNEVHFFIDKDRLTPEAIQQLQDEKVNCIFHPYKDVRPFLKNLCQSNSNHKVWISDDSSHALHSECHDVSINLITPVALMKLIKNEIEINGMKKAHIRDAVALVKYFAWLEKKLVEDGGLVTEVSGADRLEQFRAEQDLFKGLSFDTISSAGKHGAIIHYHPTHKTDALITCNELYLCDSGAQFLDGTTDVTRTLHFGTPTDYEKECFTLVFKGQANLCMQKFPAMIKGNYLDAFARQFLWNEGLNYLHGTGHGVGSYLNVHEFPASISWRPYPSDPGLQAGIFISNEPGYYEDGKFGIRLENIELVVETDTKYNPTKTDYLTFETVTLVPIQTKMIVKSMLTEKEIKYLNAYHQKCLSVLQPLLQAPQDEYALNWLIKETKPI